MSIEKLNKTYVETFQNKMLDDVIQDYINGVYNRKQLMFYLEWNEFNVNDIDMKKIEKAKNQRKRNDITAR